MPSLRYYSTRTVQSLLEHVDDRLDWYYEPGDLEVDMPDEIEQPIRDSGLDYGEIADLLSSRSTSTDDDTNALAVYGALNFLTRQQAADERLWTYLCHVECPQYTAARWLDQRPADRKAAARKVQNHFFVRDNRSLVRDNALSRLWWLGLIAHEADAEAPALFLKILLHKQDIRSALIERPSISMNARIIRAIYVVMREHWEAEAEKAPLFLRDKFRLWMINLNRRGGVVLLDALGDNQLDAVIRAEAKAALDATR